MKLILHAPSRKNELLAYYRRAFERAVELRLVAAYLTDWNSSLVLNSGCHKLKVIIGGDFGITRVKACKALVRWIEDAGVGEAYGAARATPFHPKAVFWEEADGSGHALVGSSNLTKAAFYKNYEANVYVDIIERGVYDACVRWVDAIPTQPINEWLLQHVECPRRPRKNSSTKNAAPSGRIETLPQPIGTGQQIAIRRTLILNFNKRRSRIEKLFRDCARGRVSNNAFYDRINEEWSSLDKTRMQGRGWHIRGKSGDFHALAHSLVRILNARSGGRDRVVEDEIDALSNASPPNPARKAFLSEMLCLFFPSSYAVWNGPEKTYLRRTGYRSPRGWSEGRKYLHRVERLRSALRESPNYPAKNLAELDTVLWLAGDSKHAAAARKKYAAEARATG